MKGNGAMHWLYTMAKFCGVRICHGFDFGMFIRQLLFWCFWQILWRIWRQSTN